MGNYHIDIGKQLKARRLEQKREIKDIAIDTRVSESYIEAIEEVYGNSSKVLLDKEGSGNLLYLPLDKIINQSARPVPAGEANRSSDSQAPMSQADGVQEALDARERRVRQ